MALSKYDGVIVIVDPNTDVMAHMQGLNFETNNGKIFKMLSPTQFFNYITRRQLSRNRLKTICLDIMGN